MCECVCLVYRREVGRKDSHSCHIINFIYNIACFHPIATAVATHRELTPTNPTTYTYMPVLQLPGENAKKTLSNITQKKTLASIHRYTYNTLAHHAVTGPE